MAQTYRSGSNLQVVIGAESSYGTPGSSGHVLPVSSVTVPNIQEEVDNPELSSGANVVLKRKGLKGGNGFQVTMPVSNDSFGLMCYFFFGSYAVTGSGPYDHVYKIASTWPDSVWLEIGDTGLGKYDIYKGLYIQSLQLSGSKASETLLATWTLNGSGDHTLNGGSAQDGSADTYTEPRHTMPNLTTEIATAVPAYISEFDCTISRPVDPLLALDGNLYAASMNLGQYEVDCSLTGWRDTSDNIFGLDNDTDTQVEIISPDPDTPANMSIITFPEARIVATEGYSINDSGPIPVTVKVNPYYDDNSDATSIMVDVTSTIADYSAL